MTINEAIKELEPYVFTDEELTTTIRRYSEALSMAIEALKTVQEHKGTFEWCVECKEYDQEQHCCHRWTKQIRKTIKEWESENGIVRCGQCKYRGDNGRCSEFADDNIRPSVSDFCSYGECREDGEA